MGAWSYLSAEDGALCQSFMDRGYVIRPAENLLALQGVQTHAAELAAKALDIPLEGTPQDFLDNIHNHVDAARLNAVRLAVFRGLNADPELRRTYYAQGEKTLATLIGNELAMQRKVNLSIQLPHDDSSLLPVHADVWSGDSPFELVMWIPLVDCFKTKSMYLMPPGPDGEIQQGMAESGLNAEELYHHIEPHVEFLDIPFGSVLVFSQNLMHGNRVNVESTSRWSMNCRFKSLLAPYGDKRLGEFFEPLVIRPASYLGMTYSLPGGFK